MTTWVLPEGSWQHDGAADGDLLLRPEGDVVVVGRVTAGAAEWLGPLPEGTVQVPSVEQPAEHPELTGTVAPLAEAAAHQGG